LQGPAQLIAFRSILGVVNYSECAARKWEGNVKGLGFRAQFGWRRGNDRDGDTMLASGDGCPRATIVGFDGEDYVELFRWVIEPLNCRQQLINHARIAPERGDDAVNRPFLVWRGGESSRSGQIRRGRRRLRNNPDSECCWQRHKKRKDDHAWRCANGS